MKKITLAIPIVLALFAFGFTQSSWAQGDDGVYYDLPDQGEHDLLSADELDKLLGPIALYPDPLIAQILPAATFIDQIGEAAQYLRQSGTRAGIDAQPWDVSVKAVAHYPDVLYMMDENYDWTVSLGQAYVDQPQDVMDSVQRLRAAARAQGNLYSTKQQQVVVEQEVIRVVPASPEYVYVPVYDPDVIYYERYSPAFPFITFTTGFVIGAWLNRDCDWHRHRVYYHGWRGGGWVGRARPHIHDRRGVYINRRAANININHNVMQHDVRPFRQELRGETIRRRQGPMLRPGHQVPGRIERRRERQGTAGTPPGRGERAMPGRGERGAPGRPAPATSAPATSAPATPAPGPFERRGQGNIKRRGPEGSEGEVPAGERRIRGREMGGGATGGAVSAPAVRPAPVRQVPAAQPPAVRQRPSSTGQRPAPPIRSRSITGPSTSGQSTGGDVSPVTVQPTPVPTPAVRQPAPSQPVTQPTVREPVRTHDRARGVPRSPRGESTGRESTIYRQRGESGREGIRQPRPAEGPRSVTTPGPTTPAVRSVPQSRPAPRIERPVVVPPSPRSSVPSVPRTTAPATHGPSAPVVPRASVPAPPRSAAPSVPRSVTVPITPRASTPVIPRSSAPAVPSSVPHAIPRSSVPASVPRSAPPASPSAVAPATPGAAPVIHGGPVVPTGR